MRLHINGLRHWNRNKMLLAARVWYSLPILWRRKLPSSAAHVVTPTWFDYNSITGFTGISKQCDLNFTEGRNCEGNISIYTNISMMHIRQKLSCSKFARIEKRQHSGYDCSSSPFRRLNKTIKTLLSLQESINNTRLNMRVLKVCRGRLEVETNWKLAARLGVRLQHFVGKLRQILFSYMDQTVTSCNWTAVDASLGVNA